jgi:uncharacterized protein (TIGR00269 family)
VPGREQVSCSICGTLRRRALNILAREEGATKIATGHGLDDESQSVLMNYLRGDLKRSLKRPASETPPFFIPRIKPLRYLPEREVMVYGMLRNLVLPLPECPYTRYALRADVRKMLGAMEYHNPGTMMNILTGQEHLGRTVRCPDESPPLSFCHECGEPATGALCATCSLLLTLGIGSNNCGVL